MIKNKIICIIGPTASYKTKLSIKLSQYKPINIISIDSMNIYKYINICTSKPKIQELKIAPHKLINFINPTEIFYYSQYYYCIHNEIINILLNKKIPLLVGGSMYYFKLIFNDLFFTPQNIILKKYILNIALLINWNNLYYKIKLLFKNNFNFNYNNKLKILRFIENFFYNIKTPIKGKKKKTYKIISIMLIPYIKFHKKIIKNRIFNMLKDGILNELINLIKIIKYYKNILFLKCIGYKEIYLYLNGKINYNLMINKIYLKTLLLVNRQKKFFIKQENKYIIKNNNSNKILNISLNILKNV